MMNKKNVLPEIALMRPILFFLLVVYHCFIIYSGGWSLPSGVAPCEIYAWISKFSYSFLLEAFVFISGYVFAAQMMVGRYVGLKDLVANKFKRLLLPSIVFGCVYLLVFYSGPINATLLYSIAEGVSHLWYLPMLFWTFIICFLLLQYVKKSKWCLAILFVLCLVSYVPLPFRINNAMYYALFFYLGYLVYNKREWLSVLSSRKYIRWGIWPVFVLIFFVLIYCRELLNSFGANTDVLVCKIASYSMATMLRVIYATIGVIALYITSLCMLPPPSLPVVKFGGLSMGVYIIHQFIIMIIYYKTNMPNMLGGWLPWAVMIITIIISTLLTVAMKRVPIIKSCI